MYIVKSDTVYKKKSRSFYFRNISLMRKFGKVKPSQNVEDTLLFTDVGESCPSCEYLTSQICLLMLLSKTEFSHYILNFELL